MKLQTDVAYLVENKQAFHEIQGELFKREYKWLTCGNRFKKLQDSDFPRYVGVYGDKLIMTSKKNSFERPVITFNKFDRFEKETVDLDGISGTFYVYSARDAYALETQLVRLGYTWQSGDTRYVKVMEETFNVFNNYDTVYFLIQDGRISYGYLERENSIEFHAGDTIYLHEGKLCVNKVSKQYPVPEEPATKRTVVKYVEVPFYVVVTSIQGGTGLDQFFMEWKGKTGLSSLKDIEDKGVLGFKFEWVKEHKFFKRMEEEV